MLHEYVWYCNKCTIVKFDTTIVECEYCRHKMKDIGFIQSIEEAMWWGQKHPEAAISPSLDYELRRTRAIDPTVELDW